MSNRSRVRLYSLLDAERYINDLRRRVGASSGSSTSIVEVADSSPDLAQLNTIQLLDNGTVFLVNGSGVATLIESSSSTLIANVKDYGAIGDGVANDSAAFSSAIATGFPVEVPMGDYLISTELALNDGQTIFGYGRDSNIVTNTNGSVTDLTTAYNILTITNNCRVTNLRFTGNGQSTYVFPWTTQNAIWVKGNDNQITDCEFNNLRGSGVLSVKDDLSLHQNNRLSGSKFIDCTCGVFTYAGGEYWVIDNCTFFSCNINLNERGANNAYSNCNFTYGDFGLQHAGNGGNSDHSSFTGCVFNHNSANTITSLVNGVHFVGCSFFSNPITISESVNVLFNGCALNAITITVTATTAKETLFLNCYSLAATTTTFTNSATSAVITRKNNTVGAGGTVSLTTPLLIGGTAVGDGITYKGTTANGTSTAAAHIWTGGNNGATQFMRINNDTTFGIGTDPFAGFKLTMYSLGNSSATNAILIRQNGGGNLLQFDDAGSLTIGVASSVSTATFNSHIIVAGNVSLNTAGNKLSVATGTNASIGVSSVLSLGTITISTTAVTASSKIFLSRATTGGTPGHLSVGTIVAATSFVINSSSSTDTSTINWWIIN